MTDRKTLLAIVLTLPLVLSACGSDDAPSESSTTTSSSASPAASSSSAVGSPTGSPAPSAPNASQPASPSSSPGSPAPQSAPGADPAQPAPAAGQSAPDARSSGAEDSQQITSLIESMDDGGDDIAAFLLYTVDHTCSDVKNRYGGDQKLRDEANVARGMTFSKAGQPIPRISEVKNVQVNGDKATAEVTAANDTSTVNLLRENGQWTLCG